MNAKWITPAVTVLDSNGHVDGEENCRVYENLIQKGMDGILLLGSIGEFFAIPMEEKRELVKTAVKAVRGRVPLIVGTNCMVVDECVAFSNYALEQGADGVIVISPYYVNLPDSSLEAFYDRIAREVKGKIYLYNYPGVTGYELHPELILKLAMKHENIVGIKDTVPNMDHTRAIITLVKEQRPDFQVFSGFDENFAHNLLCGGSGCMAGTSNFAPEFSAAFADAARRDDLAGMAACQKKIDSLMAIYSIRSLFVPIIKEAMVLRGIISSAVCAQPHCHATAEETEAVRQLLEKNGLK